MFYKVVDRLYPSWALTKGVFLHPLLYLYDMAKIKITQKQLNKIRESIGTNHDGNKMTKQQLFTIATLAYKMWENLSDDDQLEDWMTSKIAQTEQSVIAVTKAYFYDEVEEKIDGMKTLNHSDIIIGQ